MKRNNRFFCLTVIMSTMIVALNITSAYSQEIHRDVFRLPHTVNGFKVLKCDFHLHTVFSDGSVWSVVRVDEAYAEGLDAISITDHIEYRPRITEMGVSQLAVSMNSAYNIAKNAADQAGIILIPGTEITKEVPPGHFNLLFIKDADRFREHYNNENPRDGSYIRGALKEARNQDAFIIWNHPWYQTPGNQSVWFPIIDSLYNEGLIDGIEVVNATKYDPVIFGWVQDKNLTNLANTDAHGPITTNRTIPRTMTIVFANEKSESGIKEALLAKRSISYCNGYVYGENSLIESLFHASIDTELTYQGKTVIISVINKSSLPFVIELPKESKMRFASYSGHITIPPKGESAVKVLCNEPFTDILKQNGGGIILKIKVTNMHTSPDTPLETFLTFE